MQPDSKVNPTHVNAYKAELAEKEAQYNALGGEIEALKETIATMEQAGDTTEKSPEVPEEEKSEEVKDLEGLKRDELEEKAEEAGIENPDDRSEFPNKEVLAEATSDAQAESSESEDDDAEPEAEAQPADKSQG